MNNIVSANIRGSFNGWTGNTIVELDNGQIWQQSIYSYYYFYFYNL